MPKLKASGFKISKKAFIASDGTSLPIRVWASREPSKAVIIALHGFNDYRNFFDAPGDFLGRRGIITYAYDQRGFGATVNPGAWAGVETYAHDAVLAARAIKRRHPNLPLYLLGASMGGAVAILAARKLEPTILDGIILAAPAIWARETMPWYQRLALWIGAHFFLGVTVTGRGLDITPSDNKKMLIQLGRDPLVIKETRIDTIYGLVNLMDEALVATSELKKPALILYGEKDEVIPKKPTAEMLRRFSKGTYRFAFYASGYHMVLRDIQGAEVWNDINAWVRDRNSPLPSKADRYSLKALGLTKPEQ